MKTLLLDRENWDLLIDASGNIALADDPYAKAQDVANAARLFNGELYYDTSQGIPYFEQILGKNPPLSYVRAQLVGAAFRVVGVQSAKAVITGYVNRQYTGYISFTDDSGQTNITSF